MLQKDDHTQQMVYYQVIRPHTLVILALSASTYVWAGIGTYTVPQIVTPIMSKVSKTMDEAVAWCLDAHVMGRLKPPALFLYLVP